MEKWCMVVSFSIFLWLFLYLLFLYLAYPITSNSRYILAGFCDFGTIEEVGERGYKEFLNYYDPFYDGYAAQAGFMTGDLIIGMSKCVKSKDGKIKRKMVDITDLFNEEFKKISMSCEENLPEDGLISFRVRRLVPDDDELF